MIINSPCSSEHFILSVADCKNSQTILPSCVHTIYDVTLKHPFPLPHGQVASLLSWWIAPVLRFIPRGLHISVPFLESDSAVETGPAACRGCKTSCPH